MYYLLITNEGVYFLVLYSPALHIYVPLVVLSSSCIVVFCLNSDRVFFRVLFTTTISDDL